MAKLSDLLPLLRPELRGCPDFTIEAHVLRVVRDFCAGTWVWTEWLDEWLEPELDVYRLMLPDDREVVAVSRIWIDGRDMEPADSTFPGYEDGNDDQGPGSQGFVFQPPDRIRFLFLPERQEQFFVLAVFVPALSSSSIPDFLLQRYEDGLASGVKYRLMRQPGQNWTNPQLGEYYRREYEKAKGRARIEGQRQYGAVSIRVQPKRFI